jgi:hypothetical protein
MRTKMPTPRSMDDFFILPPENKIDDSLCRETSK